MRIVAIALTVYGIETKRKHNLQLLSSFVVKTALTIYSIETYVLECHTRL